MTPEDVAEYLSISPRTVYSYAQQGKIPAIKLGGQWRFKEEDIFAWVDNQTSNTYDKDFSAIQKPPDQIRKEIIEDAEAFILDSMDKSVSTNGRVPLETILDHKGIEDQIILDVLEKLKKGKQIHINTNKKTKIKYIERRT